MDDIRKRRRVVIEEGPRDTTLARKLPTQEHVRERELSRARFKRARQRLSEASVLPTNIRYMRCRVCKQGYSERNGLPIDGKTRQAKPCTGLPVQIHADRRYCGEIDYDIWYECQVIAAPKGTYAPDLSRKRND